MRKSQRVVLRSKVRRKLVKNHFSFFMKTLKISAAAGIVLFTGFTVHDFMFRKDTFLIKKTEIKTQEYLTPKILAEMKALSGRSTLSFSCSKIESGLKQKYPELGEISVHRLLPDRLLVSYTLRVPVALVRSESAMLGIDNSGKIFPLAPGTAQDTLPELAVSKSQDPENSLRFIENWAKSAGALGLGDARLARISVNDENDLQAELKNVPGESGALTVAWGELNPSNFSVKFERFRQVLEDLHKKNAPFRAVNLAGVPAKGVSVLENREVVGRVVVELIQEKKG